MRHAQKGGRANDFMAVPRPVVALARDLPPSHEIDWHSHPRFQLVYATRGVLTVDTRDATWVVPPQRAVWMPGHVTHEIRMSGAVSMRTLYVRVDKAASLPPAVRVIAVSPLLRELILQIGRASCRERV